MLTLFCVPWLSNRKFATTSHLHYALHKSSQFPTSRIYSTETGFFIPVLQHNTF